jgi:hypothetical protein
MEEGRGAGSWEVAGGKIRGEVEAAAQNWGHMEAAENTAA